MIALEKSFKLAIQSKISRPATPSMLVFLNEIEASFFRECLMNTDTNLIRLVESVCEM